MALLLYGKIKGKPFPYISCYKIIINFWTERATPLSWTDAGLREAVAADVGSTSDVSCAQLYRWRAVVHDKPSAIPYGNPTAAYFASPAQIVCYQASGRTPRKIIVGPA
ncbi:hypothetical protein PCASD_02835 [Puccinia coronata f. sp. avenae]|uniref:Uncharacterized protein n=1 Tax=Puccinia coronata f. sp. avenae TaxID=200324 RepID=A0A2N5VG14_9BASI|nr:hypothetical protein PCASD_02835 [Puccinia coronata f. sp. avenae]